MINQLVHLQLFLHGQGNGIESICHKNEMCPSKTLNFLCLNKKKNPKNEATLTLKSAMESFSLS